MTRNWIGFRYGMAAIAAFLGLAGGPSALAQGTNLVVNGSFEEIFTSYDVCGKNWYNVGFTRDCTEPGGGGRTIPGWAQTGEGVNWYGGVTDVSLPWPYAPHGDASIDLIGGGKGRIEQLVPTSPGVVYTLSFRYARNAVCSLYGVRALVKAGADGAPGANFVEVTPTATGANPTDWQSASFGFAGAQGASSTLISFESLDGLVPGRCGGVLIDYVSVTSGSDATQTLPPSIAAVGALPDARVNVPYTYSFSATGDPTITWDIAAGTLPEGLSLNPATGVLSGTPTTIREGTIFTVRATNSSGSATVVVSLDVVPLPPVITVGSLAAAPAVDGSAYTHPFMATGMGTPTIGWDVASGALPPGLTLSPTGLLGGTPTATGTFTFFVRAYNSGGADTGKVELKVLAAPPVINPFSTPSSAAVGVAYARNFTAKGTSPIAWSYTGSLPPGLGFSATGLLDGTPTTAGTFSFTIRAANAGGEATANVTIVVNSAPPDIAQFGELGAVVGVPYSFTFTSPQGSSITWSVASGDVPAGLVLSASGVLSGTPTTAGISSFTIRATNSAQVSRTAVVTIKVIERPVINTISFLDDAVVGVSYTRTFTAAGTQPIQWSVQSGSLPGGLSLAQDGVLSGVPTTAGLATFTIRAYNTAGEATAEVTLNVVRPQQGGLPQTGDDCKKDGWQRYGIFRNQGDCVSYVATQGRNPPAGT